MSNLGNKHFLLLDFIGYYCLFWIILLLFKHVDFSVLLISRQAYIFILFFLTFIIIIAVSCVIVCVIGLKLSPMKMRLLLLHPLFDDLESLLISLDNVWAFQADCTDYFLIWDDGNRGISTWLLLAWFIFNDTHTELVILKILVRVKWSGLIIGWSNLAITSNVLVF